MERIELGLYNLLKGQRTPYLISFETIHQGLDQLKGTYNYNEALQLESSFLLLTIGTIFALRNITAFKSMSTIYIYKYIPISIASNDNGSTLIIEPEKAYISLSLKEQCYMEIIESELQHRCKHIKDTFF